LTYYERTFPEILAVETDGVGRERPIGEVVLQVAGGPGIVALVDRKPVSISLCHVVLPLHVRVDEGVWYRFSIHSTSVYLLSRVTIERTFANSDRGQFGCMTRNRGRPGGRSREQGAGLV
jgi:hypothetical protein